MHPATKQHIAGMLGMIRQACLSVEAALAQDSMMVKKTGVGGVAEEPSLDEERYISDEQENMLGKMLGLIPEEAEAPKPKGKKS